MVYFIGIGGIGMSALAQYFLEKGEKVFGSDLFSSEIIDLLKKKGAKIFIGKQKAEHIKSLNCKLKLLIYSPAISSNNPELKEAKKRKIKCLSYPQALGELTKRYYTIAICGTHGKSTTSALSSLLLKRADFDPTVILGTKLKEFKNSNFRWGRSQYLVIEADEYKEAFLNYWPKIIILTNLEQDHLDFYKNFNNYLLAFKKFIFHLPKDGVLIANKDDENVEKLISSIKKDKRVFEIKPFSLEEKIAEKIKKILKIPGEFNVSNALAVFKLAEVLKISHKVYFEVISKYRGSWRRFEEKELKIGNFKLKIISDYAHHPTEVKVTLEAIREKWKRKRIICIYQPHQYQRTYYLWKEFIQVFKKAPIDEIIITNIYDVPGREEKEIKEKINSKKLVEEINKDSVIYLPKGNLLNYLRKRLKGKEILVIMGAGDIYNFEKEMLKLKSL